MIISSIYMIDDDPVMHFLIKKYLGQSKHSVNSFHSYYLVQEALDRLLEAHQNDSFPEVIILDINMPEKNGFDFLKEFNRSWFVHYPNTYVILLTGSIVLQEKLNSSTFEFPLDYLIKPVTQEGFEFCLMQRERMFLSTLTGLCES